MLYNRCKDTHKFGNKYLPSVHKMHVDFRSHFSGKKVCLIAREIRYLFAWLYHVNLLLFEVCLASGVSIFLFIMTSYFMSLMEYENVKSPL